MKPKVAATVVAAALIAAACGTSGGDVEAPPLFTSPTAHLLDDVEVSQIDCPERLDHEDIACGVVTVPIDRGDASAGTTRITIATMRGYDTGFLTPVAVLQGGPGGASTDMSTWFPQQPFTQVFIDQRGTGYRGPDFDCTELTDALPRILSIRSGEGGVLGQAAVDDCARRLDDDPVLAQTHSVAHAADVADVMAVLGYDRWVAYGVSYGTTIGLELLRNEPAGLAGVVLDGVYPPELDVDAGLAESATSALEELDGACAADAICRSYIGEDGLKSTVLRVIDDLDKYPMVVQLGGNELGIGESVNVVLDGRRFAEFTFLLLYSESRMRYLPAIIGGLDERDRSSARWLASTGSRVVITSQAANDEGTYFAVQCHDRLPFTDGPGADLDAFAGAVVSAPLAEACAEWQSDAAGPEAADPVESAVSTLLLSGRFDPITPPAYAEEVATRLEHSTVVEQDGRGHGIWYGSDCIARIVQSFVADPARDLDTSCADDGVGVDWARP